ncbi:hypothetical protein DW182_04505 [Bacteroides sp. AM16-24]|nr:hypothetical protein DXD57_17050 [Bacteroides intestinalis]RGK26894.1 hypothetical protein DXD27_03155 [Bacteroides intestinalis]RHE80487.1 hypothetical protein DW715_15435 [Bacteroides intestinalis]RHI11750.1 hypothetical protein DW182_04505 [Bacteroides sp. AM16-24]
MFTNYVYSQNSRILNLIQSYTECHSVVYLIGFSRILNRAWFSGIDNQKVTKATLPLINSNKSLRYITQLLYRPITLPPYHSFLSNLF